MPSWFSIPCPQIELCLDKVLRNGQSFRWSIVPSTNPTVYRSVLNKSLVELRRLDPNYIEYRILATIDGQDVEPKSKKTKRSTCELDMQEYILDYFNITAANNLERLYKKWMDRDPVFEKIMNCEKGREYYGIRILRQDPIECLFSFICSANNNIKRISGMVEKLCIAYGEKGFYKDEPFYAFPTIESLAHPQVEANLRKLGFGYRAKYIVQTADKLKSFGNGKDWLIGMREEDYSTAKKKLMQLAGVGPKVADCVCLMCLDKYNAVPVDTHVRQVTATYYMPKLKYVNNISNSIYNEIGEKYVELFGEHAGWAHSVLFSMDLKLFD